MVRPVSDTEDHPTGQPGKNVTRRITPAGFVLALLLFLLLPVALGSCDVPTDGGTSAGTIAVSFTGADLAVARTPLETTGDFALTPAEYVGAANLLEMPGAVQILAICAAAFLVLGAATALARTVRVRAIAAAVAAGGAAALVAVTEGQAVGGLTRNVEGVLVLAGGLPQVKGKGLDNRIGEVIHIGLGFWLVMALLVLLLAVNVVVVARGRGSSP